MANKQNLFEQYSTKMDSLKDERFDVVNEGLFNGKNSILRYTKKGSSNFNPAWIDKIEECLFDLGDIVTRPREITAEESSLTPIELAKKVNGESVQHLASHTQYIKEVDEKGNVVPAKILSHFNKEEIKTYENRFIATFVRHLLLFIEKRYEFIKSTINLETNDVLMMRNTSVINGQEVEIETKISVKRTVEDEVTSAAKDYIARIELMRQYIAYYYNTPFMKAMKTEKDVRKPILQTNIIRKNPKYHKCFEVFSFIERFDSLGVTYKVDEQYHTYSEKERKKLNYLLSSQMLAVEDETALPVVKEKTRAYKPKILTSIDDEKFCYGDLLEGPIEFVRVDEGYRKYLRNQINKDLPIHPTKQMREFYKDEYEKKRLLLEDLKELDKLLSRVEKEINSWEKTVQKLIKQRDKEEAEAAQKKLEELRAYQQKLLEEKRRKIIEAANGQRKEINQENKKAKAEELAKSKEEVLPTPEENKEPEVAEEPTPAVVEEVSTEQPVEQEPAIEKPAEEAPIEQPVEEPTVEESAPIEEAPVQEELESQEEPEPQPEQEEVSEEVVEQKVEEEQPQELSSEEKEPEAILETQEEPKPEPVIEEPVQESEPTSEPEPVKEEKAKPAKKERKAKAKKPAEKKAKEEKPAKKVSKKAEPKAKEEPKPEPVPQPAKEAPKKEKKAKKAEKAKPAKPVAKKEAPVKEKKPKPEKENIPGNFIVKTMNGYYVKKGTYSDNKDDAKVFHNFVDARDIKKKEGGKVVKL